MLSDSACEQTRNQAEFETIPLGRFKLKNVGRPFDLYAVAAEELAVPDPAELEGKGCVSRSGCRPLGRRGCPLPSV
jgi:hypothetical protein